MILTRREQAATLYVVGFSHTEIASALGLTPGGARSTVYDARRRYGLPALRHKVWHGFDRSCVMALKADGMTAREIGAALGLKHGQVRGVVQWINRRTRQGAPAAGEGAGRAQGDAGGAGGGGMSCTHP